MLKNIQKKTEEKLEYMEFIEKIEKNEETVALTSLYIHLLDQLEWNLLSEETVKEQCEQIRKLICDKLQINYELEEKEEKTLNYLLGRYIMTFVKYITEKWGNNV